MTEAFVPDWTMTDPDEYKFDFGDPSGSGSGYMDMGDMGAQYDFGGGAVFFQHQHDGPSNFAGHGQGYPSGPSNYAGHGQGYPQGAYDPSQQYFAMSDIAPLPSAPVPYDEPMPLVGAIQPPGAQLPPPDFFPPSQFLTLPLQPISDHPTSPLTDLAPPNTNTRLHSATFPLVPLHIGPATLPKILSPSPTPVDPSQPPSSSSNSKRKFDSSSFEKPKEAKPEVKPAAVAKPPPKKDEPPTWNTISRLITRESLQSPSAKPSALFRYLRTQYIDGQSAPPQFSPDPEQLRQILMSLVQYTPVVYRRTMADSDKYTATIARWLRLMSKEPVLWSPAIGPLFMYLSKTDMPVNYLIDYKIGKLAKIVLEKALEKNVSQAVAIQNAFNQYDSYVRQVLLPGKRHFPPEAADTAAKKRKVDDAASTDKSSSSVDKKPALDKKPSPPPNSKPAAPSKSVAKPAAPAKSSSADMSFFRAGPSASASASTVKPKAPLPSFKKAPVPARPPPVAAGPSATSSLLASTLSALNKRTDSPRLPLGLAGATAEPVTDLKVKLNKKGHSVRFRDVVPDGGALEDVKLFKEEIWELEMPFWKVDDDVHGRSTHDLEVDEASALRGHVMDEDEKPVEWYEPDAYIDYTPRPVTDEARAQEDRERGILASYSTIHQDPDETGVRIVERGPDTAVFDPRNLLAPPPPLAAAPTPTVKDLLAGLGNLDSIVGNIPPPQPQPYHTPYGQPEQQPYQYGGYGGYNQAGHGPQPPPSQGGWAAPTNNAYEPPPGGWSSYPGNGGGGGGGGGRGYDRDDRDRGSGGYGRGGSGHSGGQNRRNYKTQVCKFWLKNDCHAGDSCSFKHEYS